MTAFPYSENAQLQGYAGVVEFALFNVAVAEKNASRGLSLPESQGQSQHHSGSFDLLGDSQGGDEYEGDSDDESSLWNERMLSHKRAAVNHLELALKLDSRNDSFLAYLVRLKCGRIGWTGWDKAKASDKRKAAIQDMKVYLKLFYNNNTNSMLALQ